MLKKILITLIVILVAITAFIAKQPEDFSVSRNTVINASASDIFANINDFHQWEIWSPWARIDSNVKNTFEGSENGVGAVLRWSSDNREVGEGGMTIIESTPNQFIKIGLEMIKPVASSNIIEFSFKEENGQTTLTWTMQGKRNFIAKAMSLIFNCDKIIGQKFDEGLANIKGIFEGDVTAEDDDSKEESEEAAK